jgi:hypothetical protein
VGCPKCGYERKPSDSSPDWQCPACGIAIAKFRAKAVEAQALVAGVKPDLSPLQLPFPARLASAAPDLALAGMFLWCWHSPMAWRPTLASDLGILMLIEFFAIHSGFFILGASAFGIALVAAAFYVVVGGAFVYFHGGWSPVVALTWLLLSQVISVRVMRGPDDFARKRQIFHWANGGGGYILFLIVVVLVPLPRLGFGRPSGQGYVWDSWWSIPPHEVMAWGLLTFGAIGITKLLERPEWIERHAEEQA